MRAFPIFFLILFILFYIAISLGANRALSKIASTSKRNRIKQIVLSLSILSILAFIYLYVWPYSARNTKNYTLNLLYNAFLSIDFIFKIPLSLSIILGTLFKDTRKPVVYFIGFITSICLSSSVFYGTLFGERELTLDKVDLKVGDLPPSFDGFKILQFSDTHLGSFVISDKVMKKAEKKVKELNPSVLMFTGDLVNNFANEADGWDNIFKAINGSKKSFAILGNHDYSNYSNWKSDSLKRINFDEIVEAHHGFDFILLRNENYKLKLGNDSIFIVGVENWGHPPFPQYANLDKAMHGIPEQSFKILLTHDPAHWESIIKERQDINLTLSGHTHGMQWGIKKAGITFSPAYFVRKNWGGLYHFGKSVLYVNTGLGMVGVPWRINMPGELTLITLERVEVD